MTIAIVTDSACDLPDAWLAEHDIRLVPLHIRFGDDELVDRTELTTKQFWARSAASPTLPETSAPSPGAFRDAFEAAAAAGAEGVVCVNLSSKLSATIQAAGQAARGLADALPVRVVDSLSVTLGQGLVVQAASAAAEAGGDLDGVVAAAEAAVAGVRVYGVIDTLENLKRGGRIGGAAALLGSLLSIKPVIEVRDGVVEQESKQRTRSRSLQYLVDKVAAAGPLERLALFGADAEDFDRFVAMVRAARPDADPIIGDIGPVIGTHAGPGAVGAAWIPSLG